MKKFTLDDFSQMIDHTNLHADASNADMKKLCEEAKKYHFKMVAINQVQSKRCAEYLKGTDIHVGAAISFPLGQTTIESKVFDTENAISIGATEIDYVVNLTEVKNQNWDYIEDEMKRIVEVCRKHSVTCKVIFENCYLNEEEIVKLKEEVAANKNAYFKAYADTENLKKRLQAESENVRKYRIQSFAMEILPVLDNLERALDVKVDDQNVKNYAKGFEMIYQQLVSILEKEGVKEIDALDKPFDPNYHQALMQEPKEGVESGMVIEVLQKGYMLKDRVLRATLVKVSE